MSKEALLVQITSDPRLPTPPSVALQVLEKANRPQCTIGEIGKIIGYDPSLCGKILKMVNSSFFGLSRSITSIERALNLLGLKRVRSLVLSLSLPAMQGRGQASPRMRDYWKASVATAIAARELATHQGLPDADSEMVAGLLCDLGVLILQQVYPDQYLQVLANPPELLANRQCELEERVLGLHHAEVSAHLLKRWRLPEEMSQAVLFHHDPDKAPAPYRSRAQLLYFAGRVAQLQITVSQTAILSEIVTLGLERYGMNDGQLQAFLGPLASKVEEFASLLQVDIGTCHQYPTLFASATENLTRLAVETSLDNFRAQEEIQKAETELKKTEEALQHTEEKLRQAMKMEAIGRLAGGVAHDFNNLLTIINGYCELLRSRLSPADPNYAFIEEIGQAGSRAAELTRQLLAFSRKQILVPEVLSLNDIISAMDKLLRRLIREDVDLTINLAPDLRTVKVDPGQMDQVIVNLAVNARDAMPHGGLLTIETANVDLDASYLAELDDFKPGAYVMLAMSDTGHGMTGEVKSRIFEPFFTTKEGKGTGLGLATVHGIIKQSGGHVSVASEINRGTTFKVYLPVVTDAAPGRTLQAPMDVPGGTETVLLTEDEESVRRIAKRTLETYGYRVFEACDGWDALQVSQQITDPIDLLITDTIMPNMGGCELAQRLSRIRPNIKVLYTSGYTDEGIIRQGVLNADTPFLQKPFTPQALASKVRDVLQR